MKTLMIATLVLTSILTVSVPAHAYDPCYGYPDNEKTACYIQYQEREQASRDNQARLNNWANQINNDDNTQKANAQAEYNQLQQNQQIQALINLLNNK